MTHLLEEQAADEETPPDWCYVNNFDEGRSPTVLRLPAGRGQALKDDVDALIETLKTALPAAFESEEYQSCREMVEEDVREDLVDNADVFAQAVQNGEQQQSQTPVLQQQGQQGGAQPQLDGTFWRRYQVNLIVDHSDTDGAPVGQINGLSYLELGGFSFGKPNRITARVRLDEGEIVNIDREAAPSGPIHSKGVFILSGFLQGRYAQDYPLSLSGSPVFEQAYGGIDGDSASSVELYVLLSALADVPLRQDLAVTGSVNQHGVVQPIGGVNEKPRASSTSVAIAASRATRACSSPPPTPIT